MARSPETLQPEVSTQETQKNEVKTLFLAQLNEKHEEIQSKLQLSQKSIVEAEASVNKTEKNITEENGRLEESQSKLSANINQITQIDTQISTKQGTIEKNTSEIGGIEKKIAALKAGESSGTTPAAFRAVIGPNNETDGSPETSEDIQKQINALEAQKTKLVAQNAQLKKDVEGLKAERIPLVASRDDLQNIVIPSLRESIAQLTEFKQTQEAEKTKLIAEKNEQEGENSSIETQIQSQEQEIAAVQVSLARAQDMYAQNVERESRERPEAGFIESFVGVWA